MNAGVVIPAKAGIHAALNEDNHVIARAWHRNFLRDSGVGKPTVAGFHVPSSVRRMRSAARSASAATVNAGLTAADVGRQEASTT